MSSVQAPSSETVARGASADAIQHHYDVDSSFYGLWLDSEMSYSCAMWDGDFDTLAQAQEKKLDYLLGECVPAQNARLLDIGCGWGAALRRATQYHGVLESVGLTLSPSQSRYIIDRSESDTNVDIKVLDWVDYEPDQPFDGIVSIGAFEHFVKFGLPREEKVESYRRFFQSCHRWLKPGGVLALQTIGKGNTPIDGPGLEDMLFIAQHIFPESDLPKLSEIAVACERWFEVKAVRNDRADYARTCEVWLDRLNAKKQEAIDLVGIEKFENYSRYLAASTRQFEVGHANLYRLVLKRVDR
uniref:SAM-dependent methyltransferase n=1 Tax=unclassified Rhodococcus (in: high G+C Gram-positive bacteria) TaxID=192944 RepID=UPI0020CE6C25|nr:MULTISPECIES: cyclopropane-fatty-acyl-phospholipid synthase family protein [unclassified Rhodococcus (in: high G+C Gram-positive bacteria)]